ncbi:uncharacterized protein KY384_001750 [Bacidia gigantensis]|uniref:uncharacterized protein n=1 Tax=Bacidia gigantensis TaxID=2732470 RepID=UPI001D04F330|nr:uncharacterized protein KY384_001750 [Bacidia gigantensis]KAG8532968.1 hypothetical protein KY384_001750 [Bacidia gigantensis]
MHSAQRNTAIRWAIVIFLCLLAIYTWRTPRYKGSYSVPDTKETFATLSEAQSPARIYDDDLTGAKQKVLAQSKQDTTYKIAENPKAPLFPAFRTSSNELERQTYDPYPRYNSRPWRRKWRGSFATCQGPTGENLGMEARTLTAFAIDEDHPIPQPMFGSYDETGVDSKFCFDRFSRFGPYGLEDDTIELGTQSPIEVEWKTVRWGALQNDCLERNAERFEPIQRPNGTSFWMPTEGDFAEIDEVLYFPSEQRKSLLSKGASYKKRSAIVLHMHAATEYTVDTTEYIRSLITELSLHSGAEYEVIVMVEAKWSHLEDYDEDTRHSIFENPGSYKFSLTKTVPEEFRENAVLYTPALLKAWYAKLSNKPKYDDPPDPRYEQMGMKYPPLTRSDSDNPPKTQRQQALQLLSLLRPDIEHFWQLNHNSRYSGHHYQLLETMSTWSRSQPRRGLWERSARYFMTAIHKDWATFTSKVVNSTLKATGDGGVWGPVRVKSVEPVVPDPPSETPEEDLKYEWGVDEEADLITAAPIIDVTGTGSKEEIMGYSTGTKTPQRMVTHQIMTRYSKRLLRAMHHGQITLGTSMPMDRYPASTALHHGLKAVTFPLPTYLDYAKVAQNVDKEYNYREVRKVVDDSKLGRKDGEVVRAKTQLEQRANFDDIANRMSFFEVENKESAFADELYKRWLGYVSALP